MTVSWALFTTGVVILFVTLVLTIASTNASYPTDKVYQRVGWYTFAISCSFFIASAWTAALT